MDDPDQTDELDGLCILESFTVPLSAKEREERERVYRESGQLTREMIVRLLAGEFR